MFFFHGIDYMRKNNIIVSEEEKKKIMDLVNANKDTIYADCREQAAYEEDEDYEESNTKTEHSLTWVLFIFRHAKVCRFFYVQNQE